jgi:hypothetical protein
MRSAVAISLLAILGSMGCNPSPDRGSLVSDNASFSGGHSPRDPYAYVRLPQSLLTKEFIAKTGFNRDHKRDDLYAFGYLDQSVLAGLSSAQRSQITELDSTLLASTNFDAKTLELLSEPVSKETFEDYHNYQAMTDELQRLADAYPELATLESAGKSVQGRELWVMKISDNADTEEEEPKLLYVANMHGDEVVGRELMIYLTRQLLTEYQTSDRIRSLVDNAQIYIMPSMNPDGFERRSRFNANNSDLNRNFPDFTSDPRDTPANRQPETKAVMALHDRHHFAHALNFHGGDVCFNMPWDTQANARTTERFGDDPLMQSLARTYADANPTMKANDDGTFNKGVTYGYEWYEVDGGLQDWSSYYRRSFHATIELSYTKWPPADKLPAAWNENKESVLKYLEQGLHGIHLEIVDESGAPVDGVSVAVSSATRSLTYQTSYINRATLPGTQTVRLAKPGYQELSVNVPASYFTGNFTRVLLKR